MAGIEKDEQGTNFLHIHSKHTYTHIHIYVNAFTHIIITKSIHKKHMCSSSQKIYTTYIIIHLCLFYIKILVYLFGESEQRILIENVLSLAPCTIDDDDCGRINRRF